MTLAYNALNLPDVFTFTSVNPNNRIEIGYDAGGMNLEKQVFTGLTLSIHKRYVGGIEYTGANLEGIYHAEGRLTPNGANFRYEYTLKDHLGNSRVSFAANGTAMQVLQENHYYPFGMEMRGSWVAQSGTENAYQYTGKELNEDFSLNWSDYGARWYDASVGRWNAIDPLAEDYLNWSPYNYVLNSPIGSIDPNGMNVIINFSTINGKSHIEIVYTGVLIDKTGTQSQEQLTAIQDGIMKQLEESFTGESDEMSWGITVNLRVGVSAEGTGETRESTINLINDPSGSSTHHNGFDADVALNTFTGNLFQTAAHEVGHTMGLPHIIEADVENKQYIGQVPLWGFIDEENPIYGNLMFPGSAPKTIRGGKVLESQVHNIVDDFNAKRLNKEGEEGKGSTILWGNSEKDTPVYKFRYSALLKRQQLLKYK